MTNMDSQVREKNLFYHIIWTKFFKLSSEIVRNIFVCYAVKTKILNYKKKSLHIKKLTWLFLKLCNSTTKINKD